MKEFCLIFISLMLGLFLFHVIGIEERLDTQNAHLAAIYALQVKATSHLLYGEARVKINPDWMLGPGMLPKKIAEKEGR